MTSSPLRDPDDPRTTPEVLADVEFETMANAVFDRHYAMVALITLCPKAGEPWTEERMLLWVEIVEKTARLIYGLPSEWGDTEADRLDVLSGLAPPVEPEPEPEPELQEEPVAPPPVAPTAPPAAPKRALRQWGPGELDAAILRTTERSRVTLRRSEIAERIGANPDSVTDALARLRAAGKVEKCGEGSGTSYRFVKRAVESVSCRASGCILAARPGKDLCERHAAEKEAASL